MHGSACFKQRKDSVCPVVIVNADASDKARLAVNETVNNDFEVYQAWQKMSE